MYDQRDLLEIIKYALRLLSISLVGLFSIILIVAIGVLNPGFFENDNLISDNGTITKEDSTITIEEISILADDPNLAIIKTNCTACHSAKLIVQNRATREGWKSMIVWMQKNQKLWDLGKNEDLILDYLAKNYAPEAKGRRPNLTEIEWYSLD